MTGIERENAARAAAVARRASSFGMSVLGLARVVREQWLGDEAKRFLALLPRYERAYPGTTARPDYPATTADPA